MAFAKKAIDVSFSLASGQFSGGGNSAAISGARVSVKIAMPGGATAATAQVTIYGLPMSMMNQLSTVGRQINLVGKNTVSISAGDEGTTLPKIFQGTIINAWVDGHMPDVAFRVMAIVGQQTAVQPAKPTSIKGSADVAGLFGQIAKSMGYTLENNGISAKVLNPYLWGSLRSQAQQLAAMAGVEMFVENEQTLAIWKPGQTRQGGALIVKPGMNLIGYPAFNQGAVICVVEYDPTIKYGKKMSVTSALTPACGDWSIANVDLDIEAQVPHGKWMAVITGVSTGAQDASSNE